MAGGHVRIGAVVDLGSTSVHLLVAGVIEHRIEPLVDESSFLGLGAIARDEGLLGSAGRERLVDKLAGYAVTARRIGASHITFVGTEPLRRLADTARLVADVDAATGVPLHVVSHEEEAFLMLVGVTAGRPVEQEVLVVDIGGGSSEFVSIGPRRPAVAAGVRVGAAELTSRFVSGDPPTPDELAAMRTAAAEAVVTAPEARPDDVVIVGGTASNLLKLAPPALAARRMGAEELGIAYQALTAGPADVVAEIYQVKPARVRILRAGAAIVEAILTRYGVSHVRIAEEGIREGTVLAVARAGGAWRDQLERLAHGWVR